MENNENVFTTPTYLVNNFVNKHAMEVHLEYKINAVIEAHEDLWNITEIERFVTDDTASATISMKRKKALKN